ncbi:hypothetical protein LDENG_00291700 [Lucifuga dentata]|nr:hypothetical protein LDENG_00291700 [Lucifuga dentata]
MRSWLNDGWLCHKQGVGGACGRPNGWQVLLPIMAETAWYPLSSISASLMGIKFTTFEARALCSNPSLLNHGGLNSSGASG